MTRQPLSSQLADQTGAGTDGHGAQGFKVPHYTRSTAAGAPRMCRLGSCPARRGCPGRARRARSGAGSSGRAVHPSCAAAGPRSGPGVSTARTYASCSTPCALHSWSLAQYLETHTAPLRTPPPNAQPWLPASTATQRARPAHAGLGVRRVVTTRQRQCAGGRTATRGRCRGARTAPATRLAGTCAPGTPRRSRPRTAPARPAAAARQRARVQTDAGARAPHAAAPAPGSAGQARPGRARSGRGAPPCGPALQTQRPAAPRRSGTRARAR